MWRVNWTTDRSASPRCTGLGFDILGWGGELAARALEMIRGPPKCLGEMQAWLTFTTKVEQKQAERKCPI